MKARRRQDYGINGVSEREAKTKEYKIAGSITDRRVFAGRSQDYVRRRNGTNLTLVG